MASFLWKVILVGTHFLKLPVKSSYILLEREDNAVEMKNEFV